MNQENGLFCPHCGEIVESDSLRVPQADDTEQLRSVEVSLSRLNGALMSLARQNAERSKEMEQLLASMRQASMQLRHLAESAGPLRANSPPSASVRLPRWLTPSRLRRASSLLAGVSAVASLLVIFLGL